MHFFNTLIFIDLNKNRGIINKLKTDIREHAINPGQFYKSLNKGKRDLSEINSIPILLEVSILFPV